MGVTDALLLLGTGILSSCLAVGSVLVFSRGASRSTRRTKSEPEDSPSQDLRSALASLQADQAELYATLEKLTTTVKRLSSRAGMQELREQRNGHESSGRASGQNPPPTGAPKAELLRYYGMAGKVGPQFAQAQLDIERRSN
jgi:uncharacterized protein YlxW (UPF0749 family)